MTKESKTMRAAICPQYGPPEVIKIEEVPQPTCQAHQILIEVKATTVSAGDNRVRGAHFPPGMVLLGKLALGFTGPRQKILGTELAGVVVHVGDKVTNFKVGDRVVAFPGAAMGGHAERVVMAEDACVFKIGDDLDWPTAASICFGGSTALHFLQNATPAEGERILIIGGSGCIGTFAIQLATRHFKLHVTAVTSSKNAELVTELGAEEIIDYTTTDFRTNGKKYDIIMDTIGTTRYEDCCGSLEEKGRLLILAGQSFGQILGANIWPQRGTHRLYAGVAPETRPAVEEVVRMAEKGILKPVIDRIVPFERIVEAHAVTDGKHKKGSVVVTLP